MRTTTGPVPAERTKMSAPAGLWTICDLKVEGKAGCAVATCTAAITSDIAIRVLRVIVEQRPMHFSLADCGVFITYVHRLRRFRLCARRCEGDGDYFFLLTGWDR